MPKLTKTIVEAAAPQEKPYTLWCSDLPGFGVYVLPSGKLTYFVDYRNKIGNRRRLTIGRHGKLTAEAARKLAIATMGEVVKGDDPAEERVTQRKSMTVKELCTRYTEAAEKGLIMGKRNRPKKASTLYVDRGRIARHILPLLGSKRVCDITQADINRFIRDVASGKTASVEKTDKKREWPLSRAAKVRPHGPPACSGVFSHSRSLRASSRLTRREAPNVQRIIIESGGFPPKNIVNWGRRSLMPRQPRRPHKGLPAFGCWL